MKISIKSIYKETNNDFRKIIFNKLLLIAMLIYSGSNLLFLIRTDVNINSYKLNLSGAIILINLFLSLFIVNYMTFLIYDLKNNSLPQKIMIKSFKKIRPMIYSTLIFIFPFLLLFLGYFFTNEIINKENELTLKILISMIFGLLGLYSFIRLSFYIFFIVLEDEKKPLKRSLKITKNYYWDLALLSILLYVVYIPPYALDYLITHFTGINELPKELILLPLNMIITIYYWIGNLNIFLRFREIEENEKNTSS